MPIRISETDDGRFSINIDSEQSVTISYEQARRLKDAIQRKILRRPKTLQDTIRFHWRDIKTDYKTTRSNGGKRFQILKDLFTGDRVIAFTPPLPQTDNISITKEQYINHLAGRDQARAKEFWDEIL